MVINYGVHTYSSGKKLICINKEEVLANILKAQEEQAHGVREGNLEQTHRALGIEDVFRTFLKTINKQ